jgi:uncharacterized caspase-like protein
MGVCLRLFLALTLVVLAGSEAMAKRVALVIGNADYQGTTKLANPVNDAQDLAAKFRQLGFDVVEGYDLKKRDMEEKIGEFADQLAGAETGLFYYAGHGIAVGGRNFAVPTDAHLDAPAKLKFESISIDDIVDMMRQQSDVNILILDACRSNPFARGGTPTRGASEPAPGLSAVSSYAGAYTVYSAQDGAVALDGDGRNSPFALALLKNLGTPGETIETVMGRVKADVEEATKGFQSPDAKGLLVRAFSFAPAAQQATRSVAGQGDEQQASADETDSQAAADIERLVTDVYLKPDPARLDAIVEEIFTDPATSFGWQYSHSELAEAKAKWFAKYARWRLQLLPGSFKPVFYDADSATVTFDLRYKYWPKEKGLSPIAGTSHVTLDVVHEDGRWRIEMENSRTD